MTQSTHLYLSLLNILCTERLLWTSQYHHAGSVVKSVRRTVAAVAVAKLQLKKTEKTNAANGVNFWEFKGFIQNENEKNIDHQIKIGLDQNF